MNNPNPSQHYEVTLRIVVSDPGPMDPAAAIRTVFNKLPASVQGQLASLGANIEGCVVHSVIRRDDD